MNTVNGNTTPKKLLVIDDDANIRKILTKLLRSITKEGYEIHTAESGEKAISMAEKNAFEIAFIDMQLPGIDGLDTFRALKKINRNIVVVMMTGAASQERIEGALREGAVTCMSKPFSLSDVEEILKKKIKL